jgi:thiol-disulfide isomerase/thioredoxin
MTSPAPRERNDGWAPPILFGLAAALVGAIVLPRFGHGMEGKPAPDFALPVLSGGERWFAGGDRAAPGSADARVRLSEQRGKLVLLDFWASWCGPCREQAKVLAKLAATTDDVELIGINVSDQHEAARAYLEAEKPSWPVLEDAEGEAYSAYQVKELPTLVAIGRDGRVFAVRRHYVPVAELKALIEAMRQKH